MNSQKARIINRHLESSAVLTNAQHLLVSEYLDFVFCFYGRLFIRGYKRLFCHQQTSILMKRHSKTTKYILVILVQENFDEEQLKVEIDKSVSELRKINQMPIFEIYIGCLKRMQIVHLDSSLKMMEEVEKYQISNNGLVENEVTYESEKEFMQMNKVINDYLDRVGKSELALINEYFRSSKLSFSIQALLRTVDYIVFKQLVNSHYCQLESDQWSMFFQGSGFVYHRRHTVLKGKGRILLIFWLFIQPIEDYLSVETLKEISQALKHYSQRYQDVCMKIYSIESNLEESDVRYKFDSKSLVKDDIQTLISKKKAIDKRRHTVQTMEGRRADVIVLDEDD